MLAMPCVSRHAHLIMHVMHGNIWFHTFYTCVGGEHPRCMTRTRRATLAMLFVGLAIFSCLYTTQAMLPTLVAQMSLSSTQAALTISAATGSLAVCVVPPPRSCRNASAAGVCLSSPPSQRRCSGSWCH